MKRIRRYEELGVPVAVVPRSTGLLVHVVGRREYTPGSRLIGLGVDSCLEIN